MFTHTHSNSSTSPSQGSGSNVCQSSTKTCENVSNPHEGIQRGKPQRRSQTTQPNVTIANQFTVKLQRAPKASKKNTCNSFTYHSCRAIPFLNKKFHYFIASRSSTCTPINFITRMNKFVSWQTNGPQDHNIILNQLVDHPMNLQWEPPTKVLRSSV